jgi:hypothetical protein
LRAGDVLTAAHSPPLPAIAVGKPVRCVMLQTVMPYTVMLGCGRGGYWTVPDRGGSADQEKNMSPTTGTGIGLLVIGAILAFAVRDSVPGVDLAAAGYICMAGGVLAVIVGLVVNAQATRRRNIVEHRDDEVR